ncbi:hypothetical protein [Spirosoma soli]|uniref:hypothetical protein n=1 Tax=Spirosoma soli TaxID=1770529 RepID=UPI0036D21E18
MGQKSSLQPISFDEANSCLFINSAGVLFRVFCPFQVVCRIAYPPYRVGDRLVVTRIGANPDQTILFQIDREYRPHHFFTLYLR